MEVAIDSRLSPAKVCWWQLIKLYEWLIDKNDQNVCYLMNFVWFLINFYKVMNINIL